MLGQMDDYIQPKKAGLQKGLISRLMISNSKVPTALGFDDIFGDYEFHLSKLGFFCNTANRPIW